MVLGKYMYQLYNKYICQCITIRYDDPCNLRAAYSDEQARKQAAYLRGLAFK